MNWRSTYTPLRWVVWALLLGVLGGVTGCGYPQPEAVQTWDEKYPTRFHFALYPSTMGMMAQAADSSFYAFAKDLRRARIGWFSKTDWPLGEADLDTLRTDLEAEGMASLISMHSQQQNMDLYQWETGDEPFFLAVVDMPDNVVLVELNGMPDLRYAQEFMRMDFGKVASAVSIGNGKRNREENPDH